jgi:predicted metal-dependent HD superfamily phosphohydrolase
MEQQMANILEKAELFITDLYNKKLKPEFIFHSLAHVRRTVKAVNLIGENEKVKPLELEILNLAAWFHDAGYIEKYENHEEVSAEIASDFLEKRSYPKNKAEQVKSCILATKVSVEPKNKLEEIICDADLVHMGKKSFFKRSKALREEWVRVLDKKYTEKEWLNLNIQFFSGHDFYTGFAKSTYAEQHTLNLASLQEKLDRLEKPTGKVPTESDIQNNKLVTPVKPKKTPDRGIETMFRLTSKNHFTLSSIADSKAGTLISISALIISIILSVLVAKIVEEPQLIVPTILILLTLLGTIIFAVVSTRPKVTSFHLDRDDIQQKKGNLLFFGNFMNMPVEEYEWGMQEVMNDRDYLYNSLIRDIYYLGVVLGKKYRYLRYAYNTFMYGLIISVIAYIVAFAL